jgi:hypothetical protein
MPATSVTTIVPPFGNAGTTGNPHLANNVDAGGGGVISGMSRLANVVTVTTSTPHGLVTGRNVGIWGTASPSANDFNGFPRTITVTSTTTFTFSQGGPNESATAAGGGSIATSGRYYNYTQANTFFGYSLATFPTVPNSSGQDLVICAPWRDSGSLDLDGSVGALGDIGTCYVYEGKVNGGLAGNYQVMTVPRNEIRYPGSAATWWGGAQYFGTAVTRGDWDADGRDDLVVCAHRLRKPGPPAVGSAGGCFAFYGRKSPNPVGGFYSGTGYKPNFAGARPSPEADDIYFNPRTTLVGNDFGVSVLLVDVNNNVRQDLMIGEALSENEGGPANLGRNSGRVLVDRGGF